MEFLTPEAAGLQNIPEGGILETTEQTETLPECSLQSEINQFTIDNNEIQEEDILPYEEIEDDMENTSPNVATKKKQVNKIIPENNTGKSNLYKKHIIHI